MSEQSIQHGSIAERLLSAKCKELGPQVGQCIAETLSIDAARITPASVLLELGAQSFDFVDIVFRLERMYEIELPRSYLVPDGHTVDAIVRAVAEQLVIRECKGQGGGGVE